jgi:colanic acid/amylovoran biosynthesis glycosyltransferase
MKIAFIVTEFPKLSETSILNQITGLLDRAQEVDIYPEGRAPESKIHPDVEKYRLLEHTYYQVVPRDKCWRLLKCIEIVQANFHRYPRAILNALNVFQFGMDAITLERLYSVARFFGKNQYDIIHCHFGPLGNIAINLKAIGAIHGKVVTTFRGYDIYKDIKKEGGHIYDELFKKGSLFLCVSESIKDKLIKLGCDEQKIVIHRSGVHLDEFHFKYRKPKVNGKLQLLTVARLVEKKGAQYGIEAVSKAMKHHQNIEYKIAGDGPLKNVLQALIEKQKIGDNVKLLGWQRKEQIIELLQEADIFLAPSVTGEDGDSEGVPGALVEALACGLPVLSTRHAGIPEVIRDGHSGYLVPERDTDALAQKLGYLIEHPELWPEMGRKGRAYVEEHYNLDKLNDRLVEIYRQLVNKH